MNNTIVGIDIAKCLHRFLHSPADDMERININNESSINKPRPRSDKLRVCGNAA